MNRIEQANLLARRGDIPAAVALLEGGGRIGEADCWIELAYWHLAGTIIPRNLASSRNCFRLAGEAGNHRGRRIYVSLVANGTGGPADWRAALAMLADFSNTDEDAARQLALMSKMALDEHGQPRNIGPAERLSASPDVLLFKQLLTRDECQYLVDQATPLLAPSVVIHPTTRQAIPHPVRTSDNAGFPWVAETPFIHAINRRLAAASGTEVVAGEPLQVLRYRPGQEYKPHFDAIGATDNQRVLTMLIYLNAGYAGGETLFIESGLRVSGVLGDVLMFRNAHADGRPDLRSQHAGLPVTRGEKLIASRWIRQRRFGPV